MSWHKIDFEITDEATLKALNSLYAFAEAMADQAGPVMKILKDVCASVVNSYLSYWEDVERTAFFWRMVNVGLPEWLAKWIAWKWPYSRLPRKFIWRVDDEQK